MQDIARNGYNESEVKKMLHGAYGNRAVRFRYDVINADDQKKDELTRVVSGSVSMSAFSTIKRTAKFTLQDEGMVVRDKQRPAIWDDYASKTWDQLEEGI